MTTALAKQEGNGTGLAPFQRYQPDQVNVLRKTVAKNATDEELVMFASLAARYELDPFNREIWFVKYGETPMIITSRDGYLKINQRDPDFLGMTSGAVCEGDVFEADMVTGEVTHKIGLERGAVRAGWARVLHRRRDPVVCIAMFREYDKSHLGKSGEIWKQYPSAMIQKVAESMALKRQGGITGLTTFEEVGDRRGYIEADYDVETGSFRSRSEKITGPKEDGFRPQVVEGGKAAPTEPGEAEGQAKSAEAVGLTNGQVKAEFKRLIKACGFTPESYEEFAKETGIAVKPSSRAEMEDCNAEMQSFLDFHATEADFTPDPATGELPQTREDLLENVRMAEERAAEDPFTRDDLRPTWRQHAGVPADIDQATDEQLRKYVGFLVEWKEQAE